MREPVGLTKQTRIQMFALRKLLARELTRKTIMSGTDALATFFPARIHLIRPFRHYMPRVSTQGAPTLQAVHAFLRLLSTWQTVP